MRIFIWVLQFQFIGIEKSLMLLLLLGTSVFGELGIKRIQSDFFFCLIIFIQGKIETEHGQLITSGSRDPYQVFKMTKEDLCKGKSVDMGKNGK